MGQSRVSSGDRQTYSEQSLTQISLSQEHNKHSSSIKIQSTMPEKQLELSKRNAFFKDPFFQDMVSGMGDGLEKRLAEFSAPSQPEYTVTSPPMSPPPEMNHKVS